MKTISKVLFSAVALAVLASCSHKQEFKTEAYARLESTDYKVAENSTLRIPITTFNNSNGKGSISFEVKDGSAVQNVDYRIEPASGVLNFEGNGTQYIEVIPISHVGTFTGNLSFSISLTLANGIALGNPTDLSVTISDIDHPLGALFGTYTMRAVSLNTNGGYSYPTWTFEMTQYEGDVTLVWLSNVTYFSATAYHSYTGDAPVYAKVSDDFKTITIPLPQKTEGSLSAFGLDNAYMFAHEGRGGNYITSSYDVVFTLDGDGRYVTTDSFGISHPDDIADYPDLFYYYCVNYSQFNAASYPTYFQKNN